MRERATAHKCIISALLTGIVIFCAMLIVDYSLSGNFQGILAYGAISIIVAIAYYRYIRPAKERSGDKDEK